MRFHHVIWDFDGTLFDTYPADSLSMQKALSLQGVEMEYDRIYRLMKISQGALFDYVTGEFGIDPHRLLDNYTELRLPAELNSRPYPGTKELLQDLISAGGSNYICTHRGSTLFTLLDVQNMRGLFTGFITREDGFPPKPDPTCVQALMERFHMDPKDTVMIGDRSLDILAGHGAGIAGIGFHDGTGASPDCADFQAESMESIRRILQLL